MIHTPTLIRLVADRTPRCAQEFASRAGRPVKLQTCAKRWPGNPYQWCASCVDHGLVAAWRHDADDASHTIPGAGLVANATLAAAFVVAVLVYGFVGAHALGFVAALGGGR